MCERSGGSRRAPVGAASRGAVGARGVHRCARGHSRLQRACDGGAHRGASADETRRRSGPPRRVGPRRWPGPGRRPTPAVRLTVHGSRLAVHLGGSVHDGRTDHAPRSTLAVRLAVHLDGAVLDGPRPTAHGPRPTAHGPRPTAHGPRSTPAVRLTVQDGWPGSRSTSTVRSTLAVRLAVHLDGAVLDGPRPTAHGPRPTAHGPRRRSGSRSRTGGPAHGPSRRSGPRPTAHGPRPTLAVRLTVHAGRPRSTALVPRLSARGPRRRARCCC